MCNFLLSFILLPTIFHVFTHRCETMKWRNRYVLPDVHTEVRYVYGNKLGEIANQIRLFCFAISPNLLCNLA